MSRRNKYFLDNYLFKKVIVGKDEKVNNEV